MAFQDIINKHRNQIKYSESEGLRKTMEDDFSLYLETAINAHDIILNGQEVRVIINDVKYGVDAINDKILLLPNGTDIQPSYICEFLGERWLVANEEHRESQSNLTFRVKLINYDLQYNHSSKGVISIPIVATNKLYYTPGTKMEISLNVPDGLMNVVMPLNDSTEEITRGTRLIMGGQAWKVTYIDLLTQKGIKNLTLREESFRYDDDRENELPVSFNEGTLKGSSYLSLNTSSEYFAVEDVTWTLSNANARIVSSDTRSAVVYGDVEGDIILTGTSIADGSVIYTKTIQIGGAMF